MADHRTLNFAAEADAIAEIESLRRGYLQTGNWSLPQIAFHIGFPISHPQASPATLDVSPEQKQMQGFLENVVAHGWPQQPGESPPPMRPPANVGPEKVDELIANLKKLAAYKASHVNAGPFGAVTTEKYRRFILVHAAHHLSFLTPKQQES